MNLFNKSHFYSEGLNETHNFDILENWTLLKEHKRALTILVLGESSKYVLIKFKVNQRWETG